MVDVVVMNHDENVLKVLVEGVTRLGVTVAARFAIGSAEQLAAFIREHDPRVVVYDLGPPPVETSLEKWRAICRQPGAKRPYVITTTNPLKLGPEECVIGCVLLKPVSFDEVTEAVRSALHR